MVRLPIVSHRRRHPHSASRPVVVVTVVRPAWQPRRADPIISGDPQPTEQNTTDDLDALFTIANLTANPHHTAAPAQLTDHIITLANLKGGTGKTPLAVILAQALATTAGHDDIVVVEINPRGTLSTRAPRHTGNTVIDLARAARHPGFASQPRDLDPYISWQPEGWATITCLPTITDNHNSLITPPTADDLDRIITALRSRFHVIILDTGNNDLDAAWQHAITIADHIIIPVQWDPDTLTLTQNMVRDMNHLGATHLKNRCIWVGTHAPIDLPKRSIKKSFTTALTDAGWTVHTLPADRHIASDGTITWTKLAHHHRQGHPMNHDDPSDDDLFGDTPWKNMPRHQARRHRPDKLLPTLVIILTLALITTLTWATHQTRKEPPHPPRATVTVTVTITASPHSKTPGEPPTQR